MVSDQNVYIVSYGTSSSFGGAVAEELFFKAFSYNYDFGCSEHSFSWDFGDGDQGEGKETTHAYRHRGSYRAKLTITNSWQVIDLFKTINVGIQV
jgi:PKD repeat protein